MDAKIEVQLRRHFPLQNDINTVTNLHNIVIPQRCPACFDAGLEYQCRQCGWQISQSDFGLVPDADSCSTEKAPVRHMPDRRFIAMNHVQPAALGFADLTPLFT
jgi:hypothetical protein